MRAVQRLIDGGEDPGKAIVAALKEKGTNVSAVAERYELVREDFSRVIHGRRVPTATDLEVLANELGGTPKAWLGAWFRWNESKAQRQLAAAR